MKCSCVLRSVFVECCLLDISATALESPNRCVLCVFFVRDLCDDPGDS